MRTRYDAAIRDGLTLRGKAAIKAANWIMRTFAPEYSKIIAGAIDYGICSAARDSAEGRKGPPPLHELVKKGNQ